MWSKISWAMRGMIPISWGSCSLPWGRQHIHILMLFNVLGTLRKLEEFWEEHREFRGGIKTKSKDRDSSQTLRSDQRIKKRFLSCCLGGLICHWSKDAWCWSRLRTVCAKNSAYLTLNQLEKQRIRTCLQEVWTFLVQEALRFQAFDSSKLSHRILLTGFTVGSKSVTQCLLCRNPLMEARARNKGHWIYTMALTPGFIDR